MEDVLRRLWIFLSMALPAVLGCNSALPPQSPLVGAWRSSVQFQSGSFAAIHDLQFMYVIHADGTLTESSNHDAAPPVPPAYGVWRAIRPGEFEARYEFFITGPSSPREFANGAGWMPSGRGVLTERIRLSDDGNAFRSTIRYEALDPSEKPAPGGGSGEGRGERIRL
jgi:hypothetical protein